MKHCGTQELTTERLVLRRLSIDDSEMMYNNWARDKQVTKYLRWNAHRSWGETAETLNEWEKHYNDPKFYQWGITDKHSEVLMGTISLCPAPMLKTGWHLNTELLGAPWEVGYALGRKWWNKGYMTEALCAVRVTFLDIPEENTLHYLSGKVVKLKDPQIIKQFDALDKSKNSEENHPA